MWLSLSLANPELFPPYWIMGWATKEKEKKKQTPARIEKMLFVH